MSASASAARPGLAALLSELVRRELRHLTAKWPQITVRVTPTTLPEIAATLMKEAGVEVGNVKALEAALAYEVSCGELENAIAVGRDYAANTGQRDPRLAPLILNEINIHMSAVIDATRELGRAALTWVGDDAETQKVRGALKERSSGGKATLSPVRQVIAHADTRNARAVTDEGIWEPSILQGVAGTDLLAIGAAEARAQDAKKFVGRFAAYQLTAIAVLAFGDKQLQEIADFLVRRGD